MAVRSVHKVFPALIALLLCGLSGTIGGRPAAAQVDDGRPLMASPAVELAPAQESSPLLEELESLRARIDRLEAERRTASPSAAKPPAEQNWFELSREKWKVVLGGHVQMDYIHWADVDNPPIPAEDYFEFRRLRLLADGKGYGVFDFRLQIDIEPEAGDGVATPVADVKDAYLTMNEIALLNRARIGNFFVPFSLEQVTNDTNNIFMERSIPTQGIFAADREVGLAFYGATEEQDFTWTFGTFFDSISESLKERYGDNQGGRFSGRLTWLPYYDEASKGRYLVHLGTGVLHTHDHDGLMRYRARPQIHEGPFLMDTGVFPARSSTSANLEFATVMGPVSLQSEWFVTNVDRTAAGNATIYGGYAYLSWFLTGENRIYDRFGQHGAQFSRNVPDRNFLMVPGCFSPGALEFKVRSSYLDLDELDSGQYVDSTVGLNWYWTDRIRVMFDWIHPMTSRSTNYGKHNSDLLAVRFDFNW